MRIGFVIHAWQPHLNAGSETMVTALARGLKQAGHEVKIFCNLHPAEPGAWSFRGIKAVKHKTLESQEKAIIRWQPDVLVTHHMRAIDTIKLARRISVPSVALLHGIYWKARAVLHAKPDLAVGNTEYVVKNLPVHMAGDHMVLHPPVWPEEHATTRDNATYITQVNLFPTKGSQMFWLVARHMRDHQFLAVRGGYGKQDIRRLPNVTVVDNTTDMTEIWEQTRVLMMPSRHESYGMTAIEAMASGIPVVVAETPGLREAVGYGGKIIPPRHYQKWIKSLEALDRPEVYEGASSAALRRSRELYPLKDMRRWVEAIEALSGQGVGLPLYPI